MDSYTFDIKSSKKFTMTEAKHCKGYEDFKADIKIIRNARSNCGKASLIAPNLEEEEEEER